MNQLLQLELEARGAVVMREFLTHDTAAELRQIVVQCCERLENEKFPHSVPVPPYRDFRIWNGTSLDHLLPWSAELRAIVERIARWGEDSVLLPASSIMRRCTVNKGTVGWHCDAEAASMMRYGGNCFTVWLPLDPVGIELPSLEFVLGSHKLMRNAELRLPEHRDPHRSDGFVAQFDGERYIPLIDELGAAVVFSQYILHRTQYLPTERPRLSTEFRFARG